MSDKLQQNRDRRGNSKNKQIQVIEPADEQTGAFSVSVIIFNGRDNGSVRKTLETLFAQTFKSFEAIVVDQSSNDIELKSVAKLWPQTTMVHSEPSHGFCQACNLAAEKAVGKYLLFLDTTAWLNKTALANLVEALESEPNAGVAGPLTLNPNGTLKSIGMNIDRWGRPLANIKPFEPDTELIDSIFFIPGSTLLIEKQLFNSLDGFDELYVRGMEDADLCWRARLLGKTIVVNPWSIAYCESDSNLITDNYLQRRNTLRMIIKNYSAPKAFAGGANFLKSTVIESFTSLFSSKKPTEFYRYWRALFWNLAMLPDSLKQRRLVQRKRRLSDQSILKNVLIEDKEAPFTSDRAA